MMKTPQYWLPIVQEIAETQYNHSDVILQRLTGAYGKALTGIEQELSDLYIRILRDGEVSPLSLYKEDRYIRLHNRIRQELFGLGITEKRIVGAELKNVYSRTAAKTAEAMGTSFTTLATTQAEKAVAMEWKGRNFSTSIWKNNAALSTKLEKELVDMIVRGGGKDDVVEILNKTMKVGFSNADRLVRTETMFIINQAQKDTYMNAGIEKYKILATRDSRTSEICEEQDGKTYSFTAAVVGENYPPFHVRCRTTVIPVLPTQQE